MKASLKLKIRQLNYRLRHDYLTLNNIVIVVAFLIALNWAWGSIKAMQQNYELQNKVYAKRQQTEVAKLKVALLEYDAKYYESPEYLDLAVRKRLGLATPGERQLIVKSTDRPNPTNPSHSDSKTRVESNNFQQWRNFLMGSHAQNL